MSEPTLPLSPETLAALRANLCAVIGPIEVAETLEDVVVDSRSTQWMNPANHGLWIFGRTDSGDVWAIDTQEADRVVILSHDLVWGEEVATPRDAACPVAATLAEAFAAARSGTLPIDYFTALEGEIPEEPTARLPFSAPGQLDGELGAPLPARPALLASIFGPDTGVRWDALEDAFFELEAVERAVLRSRYALAGGKPMTVEATAKTLGMTPDEVREEEARGIRWLKRLVARGAKQ